jgi:hypothetical protein
MQPSDEITNDQIKSILKAFVYIVLAIILPLVMVHILKDIGAWDALINFCSEEYQDLKYILISPIGSITLLNVLHLIFSSLISLIILFYSISFTIVYVAVFYGLVQKEKTYNIDLED